jgi:hypothetical protein
MLRSFIGGYMPRILKSQVRFILGIDSSSATFATDTNAPMCIFVGNVLPLGDFQPTILVGW